MLSREDNELVTRTGPGTPLAMRCVATGCPRSCHRAARGRLPAGSSGLAG